MTLRETLALYDDGHTFIAQNIYRLRFLTFNQKKTKQKKLPNSKRKSSSNVQAQIVSKQTYLHQEIKTKMEGKH